MADEDYEHHDLLSHLKHIKISDEPLNQLMEFANLLEDMGEFAKSEQMFRHLLIKYQGDKRAESACHSGLAIIAHRMGRCEETFEHESLCFKIQHEVIKPYEYSLFELAKAYNNLGLQYGSNGQLTLALEYFFMSNK